MSLSRPSRLAVVLTALLATLLVTATLAPAVAGPAEARSARGCSGLVTGIDRSNRLTIVTVRGRKVTGTQHTRPFRSPVTGLALMGWSYDDAALTRGTSYFRTTGPQGPPRRVDVAFRKGDPELVATTHRLANDRFAARLFAGSFGYHVLAVRGERVLRFATHRTHRTDHRINHRTRHRARHRLAYGDKTLVLRRHGLSTLVYVDRVRTEGRLADLYLATARDGALLELRVPVAHPERSTLVTVRRHGFGSVTGLSIGTCGGPRLAFLALDGDAGTARWFTLGHPYAPSARDLRRGPLAGRHAHWGRLHAVL